MERFLFYNYFVDLQEPGLSKVDEREKPDQPKSTQVVYTIL